MFFGSYTIFPHMVVYSSCWMPFKGMTPINIHFCIFIFVKHTQLYNLSRAVSTKIFLIWTE